MEDPHMVNGVLQGIGDLDLISFFFIFLCDYSFGDQFQELSLSK